MFEHRSEQLLSTAKFMLRLARTGASAAAVVAGSLAIGILGYRVLESQSWIDATLNASMILGGMGPVSELHTNAGKLFASAYALFSGVIFLTVAAILFVPVLHRLLHRFHLERGPRQRAARDNS
ncbi:MAG: hypothetical protein U1A27_03915 [Phycisphaerae bacterium]